MTSARDDRPDQDDVDREMEEADTANGERPPPGVDDDDDRDDA